MNALLDRRKVPQAIAGITTGLIRSLAQLCNRSRDWFCAQRALDDDGNETT